MFFWHKGGAHGYGHEAPLPVEQSGVVGVVAAPADAAPILVAHTIVDEGAGAAAGCCAKVRADKIQIENLDSVER